MMKMSLKSIVSKLFSWKEQNALLKEKTKFELPEKVTLEKETNSFVHWMTENYELVMKLLYIIHYWYEEDTVIRESEIITECANLYFSETISTYINWDYNYNVDLLIKQKDKIEFIFEKMSTYVYTTSLNMFCDNKLWDDKLYRGIEELYNFLQEKPDGWVREE